MARRRRRPLADRPTPSIPSKFDTILTPTVGEANAFGARTSRFAAAAAARGEVWPGPGAYHARRPGSYGFSRKGTFSASSARFSGLPAMATPGPGAYHATPARKRRGPSSSFAAPTPSLPRRSSSSPGPGAYNPKLVAPSPRAASFKEKRDVSRPVRAYPAPGEYDVQRADYYVRKRGATPLLRSKVPRGSGFVPPPLVDKRAGPGKLPPTAGPTDVSAFVREFSTGRLPTPSAMATPTRAALPGPGAYDDHPPLPAGELKISSMFSNLDLDRWGRPVNPRTPTASTPGPGWYDFDTSSFSSATSSKLSHHPTVMASRTRRFRRDHQNKHRLAYHVPGPAFYKPEYQTRKSFLLNTRRKWI
ncbi:hypothetical protein CTAYLR_003305 [Chrysophaeum taylorii]|uniref:Uncharacterized protein n=1 Tax=Chrysophaeum taylorii TaxID=2483200 RepID=A0AAD7XK20_9STRA|nr:hypothetical protein CTAYLR_003305 [Chrysophaeum taylorii]